MRVVERERGGEEGRRERGRKIEREGEGEEKTCTYIQKVITKTAYCYPPPAVYTKSFTFQTLSSILLIGASLSEPHIDGTTGRFHICIIIIIVRPSPARRAWSHEVCRALHSRTWLP